MNEVNGGRPRSATTTGDRNHECNHPSGPPPPAQPAFAAVSSRAHRVTNRLASGGIPTPQHPVAATGDDQGVSEVRLTTECRKDTAKGRRTGRSSVVDPHKLAYAAHLRDPSDTIAEIVAKTGITRPRLYRHLPPRPAESVTAAGTGPTVTETGRRGRTSGHAQAR